MIEDFAVFRRLPFFEALRDEAIEELCMAAETVHLGPGEMLFRKGDRSEGGYLVVSGCIELTGGDHAPRRYVHAGSLIGELSLLAELERSADAVAAERSELRRVRRAAMARVLRKDPVSAIQLRAYLEAKAGELAHTLAAFRAG